MQSQTPRYRCAAERGFFSRPTEISFAKFDFKVGVGQRAELGDEFVYEGPPAKWMEPINEAAIERVEECVRQGKRKTMAAETAAAIEPLKAPPRSGMTRAITDADAFQTVKDVRTDEHPDSSLSARPAPRRRAQAKAAN